MTAATTQQALEKLLKATPFNRLYGLRILSAKRGRMVVENGCEIARI